MSPQYAILRLDILLGEGGQDVVEYALLMMLTALALVAIFGMFANSLTALYGATADCVQHGQGHGHHYGWCKG